MVYIYTYRELLLLKIIVIISHIAGLFHNTIIFCESDINQARESQYFSLCVFTPCAYTISLRYTDFSLLFTCVGPCMMIWYGIAWLDFSFACLNAFKAQRYRRKLSSNTITALVLCNEMVNCKSDSASHNLRVFVCIFTLGSHTTRQ